MNTNYKGALLAFGVAFWAVAAYFIYSGMILPTNDGMVANLEAMHIQSLNFATGIGAAIVAAIFTSAAALSR